jgi:hypothetical protein
MKRTTAPNSAGGLHVDRVPGVTPGTLGIAEDRNNLQEEVAHPIELLGIALASADQYQLEKAIIGLSKPVGELFFLDLDETPVNWSGARNNTNPANPRYFPAIKRWEADQTLDSANYPLYVPKLRAAKAKSWSGSAYVTDHTVTVAGSVATGSGTAWDNLLAALAEEVLVHGSYTAWMSLNIAGTDYAITNVNAGAHTVTVSGSPATGSQTAIVYPSRIAGSSTTARLYKLSGRALMSQDGSLRVAGTRRRHHFQGHKHGLLLNIENTGGSGSSARTIAGSVRISDDPGTDGVNGTPITGPETEPNNAAAYLYSWAGAYV